MRGALEHQLCQIVWEPEELEARSSSHQQDWPLVAVVEALFLRLLEELEELEHRHLDPAAAAALARSRQ